MLTHLSGLITQFISSWSYLAVFLLMMFESMLLPIPSEVTMPFAGFLAQQGHVSFFLVIVLGAAGNLAGSLIAYAIGFYLEEHVIVTLIEKYGKYVLIRKHEYERAMKWFDTYGNSVVFFSRLLPVVRTFISLPAGLAKMNIWKFSTYTFVGSLIWSTLLTYIGFTLGKNWESIHVIFSKLQIVIVLLLLAAVGYFVYKNLSGKKN